MKIITVSMVKTFQACRRKCFWRYVEGQKSAEPVSSALRFGSLFHNAREIWAKTHDWDACIGYINLHALDMVEAIHAASLLERFTKEDPPGLSQHSVEEVFCGKIRNPSTGRASPGWRFMGKVDGVLREGENYWIEECKTAGRVDDFYLSRLHYDFQSIAYLCALRKYLGLNVVGVVYRIGVKCQLRFRKQDTEETYHERLREWYSEPAGRVYTQKITIDQRAIDDFWQQLWEIKQEIAYSLKTGSWPKNRSSCTQYNSLCQYAGICDSFENPTIIENEYRHVEPHEELRSE